MNCENNNYFNDLKSLYKKAANILRDQSHITGIDTVCIFNSLLSIVLILDKINISFEDFKQRIQFIKDTIDDFNLTDLIMKDVISNYTDYNKHMIKLLNYNDFLIKEHKNCNNNVIVNILSNIIIFVEKYNLNKNLNNEDIYGCIYEIISKDILVSRIFGQYFTPMDITYLIINELKPEPDKFIYDPCLGSGGFIISYINYIKDKYGYETMVKSLDKIYGCEILEKTHNLAFANISMNSNNDVKNIYCLNSLVNEDILDKYFDNIKRKDKNYKNIYPKNLYNKFDYIVTNPP